MHELIHFLFYKDISQSVLAIYMVLASDIPMANINKQFTKLKMFGSDNMLIWLFYLG